MGPRQEDLKIMLATIGLSSIDELIEKTVPDVIRLREPLNLGEAFTESEYLEHVSDLSEKNVTYRNYIGMGYYPTEVPSVIRRNILENPGWYTAYTPYQSEIAQGRLEALLNFQTVISDLTGKEIANASLLDEGTAAAEAIAMLFSARPRKQVKAGATTFIVDTAVYPQTFDVMKTRANSLGITMIEAPRSEWKFTDEVFGCLLQYPDGNGEAEDFEVLVAQAHSSDVKVVMATDLMALLMLKNPGKMGADVVVGSTQRFGVPMSYGGPHAAFFACKDSHKRYIPGRIIGVSLDVHGNPALRMALQTREQHIKREKATSNICTAQVLLAVMAGMYAVYHGKEGLKNISKNIHSLTSTLEEGLKQLGYIQLNKIYFDTLYINIGNVSMENIRTFSEDAKMNFNYIDDKTLSISIDEKDDINNINEILKVFASSSNISDSQHLINEVLSGNYIKAEARIPNNLFRSSSFLDNEVFNSYQSESEMMRYIKSLENRDLSLTHSMIPLGSCTMKLNAASQLFPLSWTEFSNLHPFAPAHQARGYHIMFHELEEMLCEITGFDAMSLQPNSGAQGEYAGLMVIREYHKSNGQENRNICLIPSSAHGTNPASAVMAGMKVVVTPCDDNGNIDINVLKIKAEEYKENLAALMITYPSTHGVFEESITEVTDIIHKHGGQVYLDGANMNAQVGYTNPAKVGADVCHLNLHKTFAIPHGGGGPGVGPIGVLEHLKPFLPTNPIVTTGGEKAIAAISAAPWGSALVLAISYGYIKMLGREGLKKSTALAILNANYIKNKLKPHFSILYTGQQGNVAHEMILDFREFKQYGIEVTDIAKRLMDYGFHAPTVSFPVVGTLMIEPTESESVAELDRFCNAMIAIKQEIDQIVSGEIDAKDSVLKNSPHTILCLTEEWKFRYSKDKAVFPLPYVKKNKFWPYVRRIDDAYGDRNLHCSCAPIDNYS